jgi:uncharacterized protein
MAERLTRAHPADLTVRSAERIIYGIAVPFGEPAEIHELGERYSEVFVRGAFARTIRERGDKVKLLVAHDGHGRLPIGRATLLREDAAGLFAEFKVSRTHAGDEVLELVGDGALDAFSIGFQPIAQRRPAPGRVERTEVRLREVSVVSMPAYEGALIAGVRCAAPLSVEVARRRLDLLRKATS